MPNQKSSTPKKKLPSPPEQKLGDTPVAPWDMPTPEEKAKARPVRQALKKVLEEVDSEEKAEHVIQELEVAAAGQTAAEVSQKTDSAKVATPARAAQNVAEAAQKAAPDEAAPKVLAETARVLATAEGRERETVSQAAQEVFNPEQQGAPTVTQEPQREYLRHAMLKHLKPLDAIDANLFLKINHLPHTHFINGMFYFITFIFGGGTAWFGLMGLTFLLNRRKGWKVIRTSAIPLAVTTWLVEFPIKWYFRRRRPFISIIQAIVIGKKPGTWSFPSGHSASAFSGAWLFSRHFPRLSALWYSLAGLVAFSRIYLGDHYPGDVTSGSALGILFSILSRKLSGSKRRP
jgi:membrane-associated phospholipid phosphatase